MEQLSFLVGGTQELDKQLEVQWLQLIEYKTWLKEQDIKSVYAFMMRSKLVTLHVI